MKGYDAFAGVIKSGGKTRRAAKMVILNAEHPDVVDFITCKVEEEKKAWALIDAGYDGSFNGPAYSSVFFQNSNNSVRVTDDFMRAVLDNGTWQTRAVTDGRPMDTYKARDLMRMIAEATHVCGDPGMQFDTTINEWHTCPNIGPDQRVEPVLRVHVPGRLGVQPGVDQPDEVRGRAAASSTSPAFRAAVDTLIIAQEILVDNASYPTRPIEKNSHDYRPLGLGYANLGALLMSRGLPYDSDAGRHYAAAITALMTGEAYAAVGARRARSRRPVRRLRAEPRAVPPRDAQAPRRDEGRQRRRSCPTDLFAAAAEAWDEAVELGEEHGYRNAQTTVLAPTGTIGFMMDCDTTGIEPDIALVKYKKLVDGGLMKIVNQTIPAALARLGYTEPQVKAIVDYIDENETIEGAPHLPREGPPGVRLRVQAGPRVALDPPHGPHPDDGRRAAVHLGRDLEDGERPEGGDRRGDHAGLHRVVAPRRQGDRDLPRRQQADAAAQHVARQGAGGRRPTPRVVAQPIRRKLPDERQAITHKFEIAGHEGYITVGLYEDGMPGEIFLVMAKEGSTISGFADAFAQAVSYALQYGVPLQVLVDKFSHVRFEPAGMTKNPQIRIAKSIVDYVFRWLATKFLSAEAQYWAGVNGRESSRLRAEPGDTAEQLTLPPLGIEAERKGAAFAAIQNQEDAPPCTTCGSIMVRSGSCYKCVNCGSTSGCA